MKKIYIIAAAVLSILILLPSCATQQSTMTKAQAYGRMYEDQPLTIAIMPPINRTNNVEAKEFLYTTLAKPLSEAGYYVIPPFLALEMFKTESAYDAELFIDGSLSKFKEVLGADAVIFTTINQWEKKAGWKNAVEVGIEYSIRTTDNNEEIFYRKADITYDASSNSGGGLAGLVADKIVGAINTAATSHVRVARVANDYALSDLPAGEYSPDKGIDKEKPAGKKEIKAVVK